MQDCIFCKIVKGEVPCDKVHEDEDILVFRDINPQAPVHLLIIPKKHYNSIVDMTETDAALAGHMVNTAARLAVASGVAGKGFRLVTNSGSEGGQTVPHMHFHVLGGRQLSGELG